MKNIIKNLVLFPFNLLYKISPELTLRILFRIKTKKKLSLTNPQTYNEKIQWIKLYDKNPLMPVCSDKYHVREYISSKGLGHLLNDLLWEGFNAENIPFDELPNQFVIKVTHGSAYNIICKDKSSLDQIKTIRTLKKWVKSRFIPAYGEWFYGLLKPRIIVEKYLENENGRLRDYKFFCFNGDPKILYVDTWFEGKHSINVYNDKFELYQGVKLGYRNDLTSNIVMPKNFKMMLEYSKLLSSDFLHVRVDFYEVEDRIIFGELTFTKGAGFGKIEPLDFDYQMGQYLKLPIN